MSDDLYKILGILPDADDKDVRSAYRRLAKRYHPDTAKGASAEKFRAVQHAYEVLGDAQRRAAYDRDREQLHISTARRQSPEWSAFTRGYATYSSHIDLRHLSRRPQPEPIEFRRWPPHSRHMEADPWDDLIAFLFGDF